MPVVATEQLVAAVARQAYRHVPAGEVADEEGRKLRRVGKGLVEDVRQPRDRRSSKSPERV